MYSCCELDITRIRQGLNNDIMILVVRHLSEAALWSSRKCCFIVLLHSAASENILPIYHWRWYIGILVYIGNMFSDILVICSQTLLAQTIQIPYLFRLVFFIELVTAKVYGVKSFCVLAKTNLTYLHFKYLNKISRLKLNTKIKLR